MTIEWDQQLKQPVLRAKRLGLHTHGEAVVMVRRDCPVAHAEGLGPHSQIRVTFQDREVRATLLQVEAPIIDPDQIALSESAWTRLGLSDGETLSISHAPPLESLTWIKHRVHGHRLSSTAIDDILREVAAGAYTDVHLAAFLTASSAMPLDDEETYFLTKAMVEVGEQLRWDGSMVLDKHSVGGLPGNRTTPIIVSIVAACGLTMPKTSSRAITSPAGTADTMEVLTAVDLDLDKIREVVGETGACLAWGGAIRLSPADDIFIGVERLLDIDPEGQLVASVLSKKIAAGATHVVLDIPVGPTAKIRSSAAAAAVANRLVKIGSRFGLKVLCVESDGTQPVGRGVGPALEAMDVLAVLRCDPDAPSDLRNRACKLAGALLEMAGTTNHGEGPSMASEVIASGRALKKFMAICASQGGFKEPATAPFSRPFAAASNGRVVHIDNRKIAQLAKLAGAPEDRSAGIRMQVRLGDEVVEGDELFTLYAESPGDLAYGWNYATTVPDMVEVS